MSRHSFEYLSQEAFKEFKKELEYLTKEKRKEITERIEAARELGDISENAEYQESKEEQLNIESRIAEIEDILSRAVIITNNKNRAHVELGCTINLKRNDTEDSISYQLVGSEEANPIKRKISNESPLGTALLGKKKGEKVEVFTPAGKILYTIIEII